MKLISFLHMRVGGIFVSLRSYLLETAGGLKENRPNKSGCEKVRVVNSPHFCAQWRTHTGIERLVPMQNISF